MPIERTSASSSAKCRSSSNPTFCAFWTEGSCIPSETKVRKHGLDKILLDARLHGP